MDGADEGRTESIYVLIDNPRMEAQSDCSVRHRTHRREGRARTRWMPPASTPAANGEAACIEGTSNGNGVGVDEGHSRHVGHLIQGMSE